MAPYEITAMTMAALALLGTAAEFAPASLYSRCRVCAALVQREHTDQHAAFHDALAQAVGATS